MCWAKWWFLDIPLVHQKSFWFDSNQRQGFTIFPLNLKRYWHPRLSAHRINSIENTKLIRNNVYKSIVMRLHNSTYHIYVSSTRIINTYHYMVQFDRATRPINGTIFTLFYSLFEVSKSFNLLWLCFCWFHMFYRTE